MSIRMIMPVIKRGNEIFPRSVETRSQTENYGISVMQPFIFWNAGFRGQNVTVAVIDSGCNDHKDLTANIIDRFNLTTDDDGRIDVVNDSFGHGTHVSGIIAATNRSYPIGIAPQTKLLVIKVINAWGSSSFETLIKGIELAIDWRGPNGERVDVINLSLGSAKDNGELKKVVDLAISKNISIVAAAGNEGDGTDKTTEKSYPGVYDEVFQIGSTDQDFRITNFSNTNNTVDYVTPGASIFSTYTQNDYETLSGTSMSAPQVSGIIALLLSYYKAKGIPYTQKTVEDFLNQNTIELTGYSNLSQGRGLIRIQKLPVDSLQLGKMR